MSTKRHLEEKATCRGLLCHPQSSHRSSVVTTCLAGPYHTPEHIPCSHPHFLSFYIPGFLGRKPRHGLKLIPVRYPISQFSCQSLESSFLLKLLSVSPSPLFLPYQALTISPDLFNDPLTTLLTSSLPLLLSIFHSSIGLISLKQSFTHIMPLIKNLNGSLLPPGYMPKSLAWHSRPLPSGSKQPSQDYYLLPHSMNLLY